MMEITAFLKEYQQLNLSQSLYAITHHSTTIEGSTLTEIETNLLLDDGLTPKGKPIEHSLMTMDHASALSFIIDCANRKEPITIKFIQQLNSKVMARTGKIYQTVFGELHSSKGVFRKEM